MGRVRLGITASYRPRGSSILFISPSLESADIGIVYLKPAPPLRGRITITAASLAGAFSGAMVKVRWPTDAQVAMAMPSAKQAHGDVSLSK